MTENNQPDQEKIPDDDEPILELTEEITAASDDDGESIDQAEDPLAATIELDAGLHDDLHIDHEEDDFVDSLGMEIGAEDEEDEDAAEPEETAAEPADTVPAEGIDVSSEQLDAALERVIKNMFYDKIDSVLVEVIEKTVSKEIERLKKILTEEVSGDEK
ncbi:MAG: hypothetical protein V3S16_02065 [Candidatus Desulfatibia sp.]|uniref:hypothetical protein n=1 Tax=Candidatus Desulfatibia sp. TaxID=3101189 RepID=UPI002F2E840F